MFDSRCSETLEFYTIRKTKSCERPKKNFWTNFFSFCYNFCLRRHILLKFWMRHLEVVFHIWYKMLDLFWSVRGLTSKLPTYPTCQLAPLSPTTFLFFKKLVTNEYLPYFITKNDKNNTLWSNFYAESKSRKNLTILYTSVCNQCWTIFTAHEPLNRRKTAKIMKIVPWTQIFTLN